MAAALFLSIKIAFWLIDLKLEETTDLALGVTTAQQAVEGQEEQSTTQLLCVPYSYRRSFWVVRAEELEEAGSPHSVCRIELPLLIRTVKVMLDDAVTADKVSIQLLDLKWDVGCMDKAHIMLIQDLCSKPVIKKRPWPWAPKGHPGPGVDMGQAGERAEQLNDALHDVMKDWEHAEVEEEDHGTCSTSGGTRGTPFTGSENSQ